MARTSTTPDGATLLVRAWVPATEPWAHLLLVHGVAEHSGRYERTGRILAGAGIARAPGAEGGGPGRGGAGGGIPPAGRVRGGGGTGGPGVFWGGPRRLQRPSG